MRALVLVLTAFSFIAAAGLASMTESMAEPVILNTDPPYKMYDASYALVIGNSRYDPSTGWRKLPAVVEETKIVSDGLKRQGFEVETLEDLPLDDLQKAIRSFLLKKVKRDTRMVLYFAGHGWSDRDTLSGYILPIDVPAEESDDFSNRRISMKEIKTWAEETRAKHVLLVFNSCFSGTIFLTRSNFRPSELIIKDIDRPGMQFISSGSEDEEVPDNTEFAKAFVAGMEGEADAINPDGIVTAQEVGLFVKKYMMGLGTQIPQYGTDLQIDRRHGDLVFASVAGTTDIANEQSVEPRSEVQQTASIGEIVGPRETLVRSLGQPTSRSSDKFRGVDIIYYKKTSDNGIVEQALNKSAVPFSVTNAILPDRFSVNALACGPDVPIDALKSLATVLLDENVPLRRILQFRNPKEKPRRIEILSLTNDAGGVEPLGGPVLTNDQIQALTACPRVFPG